MLIFKNKDPIIKAKGVFSDSLTIKYFKNMYYENLNIKAVKANTTTSYEKGFVSINTLFSRIKNIQIIT